MSNKIQVLVVEDESIVALDLMGLLKNEGLEVCAVTSSGEESVALAAEHKPDLILMDIELKGKIDGIAAAAEIRNKWNIPIIYLTAYADEATIDREKEIHPFISYISKPFAEEELKSALQNTFARAKKLSPIS